MRAAHRLGGERPCTARRDEASLWASGQLLKHVSSVAFTMDIKFYFPTTENGLSKRHSRLLQALSLGMRLPNWFLLFFRYPSVLKLASAGFSGFRCRKWPLWNYPASRCVRLFNKLHNWMPRIYLQLQLPLSR